jgi:hypothetical protein
MRERQALVQVGVFDQDGAYLEHADVRLEPEASRGSAHQLQWDRSRGYHLACGVRAGRYRLVAQAAGHELAERRVEVEPPDCGRSSCSASPACLSFIAGK